MSLYWSTNAAVCHVELLSTEFYEYPVTAIVAPNDSVVFSCASSGTTVMFLNYTSLIDNLDALEKERFSIIYVNISQNRQNVSVMMTASVANYSNNNTYIFCTSQGMTGEIVSLYIAGKYRHLNIHFHCII